MQNNILIIGFGSIAKRHIKNLIGLKKNTFFYILSRKKEINPKLINEKNFKHIKKIDELDFKKINYSFICTASNEHFKLIKILSKKKTNIFIEKPLMNSTSKIVELNKIIRNSKYKIYVGYNLIFSKSLNYFKKIKFENNLINKVEVKAGYYLPYWRNNIDYKKSVSAIKKMGGGVLLELSHEIHYILWIFGRPLWTSSVVEKKSKLKIDVEDNARIILGFKNFNCYVELDFISKKYIRYCKVYLKNDTFFWEFKRNSVTKYSNKKKKKILFKNKFDLNKSYIDQLKFYINSNYVDTNKYIKYSIDTLSIIDSIRNSSKNKGQIKKINYKN